MRKNTKTEGKPTGKAAVLMGLFLEAVVVIVLAGLVTPALAKQPSNQALPMPDGPTRLLNGSVAYTRVQTVTLHPPSQYAIYATSLTTTIEFDLIDILLPGTVYVPADAVVYTTTCEPDCQINWQSDTIVEFSGTTQAHIYVCYDTQTKAERDADGPTVTLHYGVGPGDDDIRLINTVGYRREFDPQLQLVDDLVTPTNYTHVGPPLQELHWEFENTSREEFTVPFIEPLVGSDLVIEHFEMNPAEPMMEEMVQYTVVVRNQGGYVTGRAFLTELLVRPYALGPPVVLTDHRGGWAWINEEGETEGYGIDALFNWYFTQTPGSYWWPGLEPGTSVTGTTSLAWPKECTNITCGVWAKVDPPYLDIGTVYEWYGYNPEGVECQLVDGVATCSEENNNIWYGPAIKVFGVYLPTILSGF